MIINIKMVMRLLGALMMIEGISMLPSLLVSALMKDGASIALVIPAMILLAIGAMLYWLIKPDMRNLRAREGFVTVALCWVVMSAFGALPFMISGVIPGFVDAFFETVSGFTTTGATVMADIDLQPKGILFWRSSTHWVGGMGVLVLTMALLPKMTGRNAHLIRAESPGPSMSKLMPKMGDSAKMLYIIYLVLTAVLFVFLLLAGMNPYDAAIHAMSTAGTGGFSNYGASIAAFDSALIDWIITIFMVLFGVNFALYYRVLMGGWRDAAKNEELKWYLFIFGIVAFALTIIVMPRYGNDFLTALRYGAFQTASIISTTGFATADYNLWPEAAKMLIVLIMFFGSCAGSTAGGMKIIRVALMAKLVRREVRHTYQPRKVQVVRFEGKGMEENMLSQLAVFCFAYVGLIIVGAFVLSLDGVYGLTENFTAALTCVSNIGPGLGAVGPVGSFAGYSPFSKTVCSMLMLCGRLELFPMMVLFSPGVWRSK